MEFVGIDWSYRRAAWCALSSSGALVGEGAVAADEDGWRAWSFSAGVEVRGVVEMMSAARTVAPPHPSGSDARFG